MTSEAEPTPPAPLPEGKGEKEADRDLANPERERPGAIPRAAEIAGASETRHAGTTHHPVAHAPGSPVPRGLGSSRHVAVVLTVLAVVFAVWYFAIRTPEARDDFGRFQGGWKLAVPADSAEAPDKTTARRTPIVVRVTGDRWVFLLNDKEQKKYTMTLRPDADPKEIDLTQLAPDDKPLIQKWPPPPQPVVLRGIYVIEGDRAKVVAAPGSEPRPTSLDATDGVSVWLLERAK